jgi:hypothetical protein
MFEYEPFTAGQRPFADTRKKLSDAVQERQHPTLDHCRDALVVVAA